MSFVSIPSITGTLLSLLYITESCYRAGPIVFIFLTIWVALLHLITFLSFLISSRTSSIQKKLLITSWAMGWYISFLFWSYIYPQIKETDSTPMWSHIVSHGLIHLHIVIIFVETELQIQYKDYLYPLLFNLTYVFGAVVPLKVFYQITIYPKFFEEFEATIVYILAAIGLSWVFFVAGKVLHARKKKIN